MLGERGDAPRGVAAVHHFGLVSLLDGTAATTSDIAERSGLSKAEVEDGIQALVDAGRIELDGDRIVGVGGLTLNTTGHALSLAGSQMHTWCALDAVGIPAALGLTATVTTGCPRCGERILVQVAYGAATAAGPVRLFCPTTRPRTVGNEGGAGARQIGPIGTSARVCVGAGLLIFGFAGEPSPSELVAAFVVLPAAELAVLLVLRPAGSAPFHLYGAVGYTVNFGTAGLLLAVWTTPALLFYGASIVLAVVKGYAGCEILALSNLLRRRDDQLACAVFSPIDALESAPRG